MYRNRTVRERERWFQNELARRDEMIQTLLDRIQHPDRTPIWREPPPPLPTVEEALPGDYGLWPDAHEYEGTEVQ